MALVTRKNTAIATLVPWACFTILWLTLVDKGARVIGQWSTDGYEFEQSGAVREGQFVGLALDDKNQAMLTNDRITEWLELIKPQLIA